MAQSMQEFGVDPQTGLVQYNGMLGKLVGLEQNIQNVKKEKKENGTRTEEHIIRRGWINGGRGQTFLDLIQ